MNVLIWLIHFGSMPCILNLKKKYIVLTNIDILYICNPSTLYFLQTLLTSCILTGQASCSRLWRLWALESSPLSSSPVRHGIEGAADTTVGIAMDNVLLGDQLSFVLEFNQRRWSNFTARGSRSDWPQNRLVTSGRPSAIALLDR